MLLIYRSFLYYLDGATLLFSPMVNTVKPRIDQVSVGFAHILAVTVESTVYSWGAGECGQLGHGDTVPRPTASIVEALKGRTITRVEAGGEFSMFLTDNGIIMSCGRGDHGCLGNGSTATGVCSKPKLIEELLT